MCVCVCVFSCSGDQSGSDRGRVRERRENIRGPPPSLSSSSSPSSQSVVLAADTAAADTSADLEDLSECSASVISVRAEDHISSYDDDDDDDADDVQSGISNVSNKSPLPYTISPPSSPPASASFPNYFIQPRVNKHSEVISVLPADVQALFSPEGPTPAAAEIMAKSRCDIQWLQHPGNDSRSESVRITGEPVDREKAKYLLNLLQKEISHVVSDEAQELRHGHESEECISRYVDCPAHFIPVLIGTGGYTIEDIQIRTSTRILINDHHDEDQPPQICIIGTARSVEEALACIERLLVNHRFKYRQRPFSPSQRTRSLPSMPPPAALHAPPPAADFSSGSGVLRKAASDTGPGGSAGWGRGGIERPVAFHQQGHQQQQYQQQQQHAGQCKVAPDADDRGGKVATQLRCPGDKVSQLIGKKGSILRELKKMSNCEISIERVAEGQLPSPSSSSSSGAAGAQSPSQLVHISGQPRDVAAAVQLVQEVIALGPVVALKMQTVKMVIPHDKVPLVIGQRGITAKEMMRRSGCKIHVNETVDADDNCFIELTGTSEQLSVAQELISDVLEHGTKALGKRFHKVAL
jgi:rRNA processing protein Krr1/Pno1